MWLRVRDTDESLHREARLKPAQNIPAASEFHGLKPVAKAKAPAKARRGGIRSEDVEVARASLAAGASWALPGDPAVMGSASFFDVNGQASP